MKIFNEKIYDVLKWVAMMVLPALTVFIYNIFEIWTLPYGIQISASIAAFNSFLAILLGIDSVGYNKEIKK